ncbi:MAG TPA: PBP1A family penicillin-binding protein [Gemmatimonadales bacterium]|nr:PBP1A family penicillin-binding protein [Gemmatimonadales bacterium]
MIPRLAWAPLHDALAALRRRLGTLLARPALRPVVARPLLAVLAVLTVGVALVTAWAGTCGFEGCPSPAELRAWRPPEGGRILDRTGALLGRVEPVRRVVVPLDRVPRHVRAAFIAVEDQRFFRHDGVDLRSMLRAAWRNAAALDVREGSSTITMQAARSAFLTEYEGQRSLRRKLLELVLARRLERALPKEKILELYLNVIYLGDDTYGVEAASRHWFGKGVDELSLAEAATLAALPRAPAHYDPRQAPERARERRDLVLALMLEQGFISPEDAAGAVREPLRAARRGWTPDAPDNWAAAMARAFADSVLGGDDQGDLVIATTFDLDAQRAAERAVRGAGRAEAALVALDPASGALRAVAGGRQFLPGGFNRAIAARRQPGSAFKPFVYAAAIEAGYTTASAVDDEPVEVRSGGTIWRPANASGEYLGRVTLRHALARSANAATVRVSQDIGPRRVVETARRLGIRSPLEAVPAVALGSFEVTPLELAAAYAPFANGGLAVSPYFVERIEDAHGRVLWQGEPEAPRQALDRRDAFLVHSMLESAVEEGTGWVVRARGVSVPMGGKTGTTNDNMDAWFVGYTPSLVAAVWVGHDERRPLGVRGSGAALAAPIWADFYRAGWDADAEGGEWTPPEGIVPAVIDAETGLLAGEYCPTTRVEWFREGTAPTEQCDEHDSPVATVFESIGKAIGKIFGGMFD